MTLRDSKGAVRQYSWLSAWLLLLIHLHQGLLLSLPNVDVNETAVELDVALKILCLLPPLCASATKGYVTTKLEMSMTLRMMMMTMSDSGST